MTEGNQVSTREWLDPPGAFRRVRRVVGVLLLASIVTTVVLWFAVTDSLGPFLVGMVAVAVLAVCYLAIWAVNLVAFYTDPDGGAWDEE